MDYVSIGTRKDEEIYPRCTEREGSNDQTFRSAISVGWGGLLKVAIGSDHAGYALKEELKKVLDEKGIDFADVGTDSEESVDYPDIAQRVAELVAAGYDRGVLLCGTGIGMSITANKFEGVRAALCSDEDCARLSREHNDSNVLAIGARFVQPEKAASILKTWLDTDFEGGRHARRVKKISRIEKNH